MTYPGGSNQVTYGYGNANRLTSVTDWNSNAVAYAYDDAGRLTTKTLPSGTDIISSYTYDTADRLTGISHVKGGTTTIASVSYTLDDVGNRTQRVDQQGTHTYAYDDIYRLTEVTYPGPATTTYTFDAFGNRLTMTNAAGTTDYEYDDADRLTEVDGPATSPVAYTWDDNGSLTNRGSDTFSWDYEERMTSATVNSVTTTFAYRGDGLRDSRTTGANTTTFTWDIASGLPVIIDDGNRYLYGAGLEAMDTGSDSYYYLADGLGSTMAIVDATGAVQKSYTYDIYGKPTATGALANEFDFAGQQTDPTGLQYLRARYMDPETGMFMSREPLGVAPDWMGNPFGYADGSPARMVDPTGLAVEDNDPGRSSCPFGVCSSGPMGTLTYEEIRAYNDSGISLIGEYVPGYGVVVFGCREPWDAGAMKPICEQVLGPQRSGLLAVPGLDYIVSNMLKNSDINGDGELSLQERILFGAQIVSIFTPFKDSTGPMHPPIPCDDGGVDAGYGCQRFE
jgi:RHS repeat-associated protein